jgi:hypothetical protein
VCVRRERERREREREKLMLVQLGNMFISWSRQGSTYIEMVFNTISICGKVLS